MTSNDYVGIGEAAQILNLSRTSVQKLVDKGQLAAIKTIGGHRRIVRSSLDALNLKVGPKAMALTAATPQPAVAVNTQPVVIQAVIVEDDPVLAALLENIFTLDYPDILCTFATNGLDAVLHLERLRPRILITDLSMRPFDGFKLLGLVSGRSEYDGLAIVVMSSINAAEIENRGGLPDNTLFFPKPVSFERLRGFLDAHVQTSRQHSAVESRAH